MLNISKVLTFVSLIGRIERQTVSSIFKKFLQAGHKFRRFANNGVDAERDDLRKDIEQLCLQQAGPSYLSAATRMHFQRFVNPASICFWSLVRLSGDFLVCETRLLHSQIKALPGQQVWRRRMRT